MGVSKILSESPRGTSFFLNTGKVLSAFLPELTFVLMVQKQWWVKLLAPWHKSRRCHETVGEGCSHHHHALMVKKGNPVFFHQGHGFDPWSEKTPHATGQLSP